MYEKDKDKESLSDINSVYDSDIQLNIIIDRQFKNFSQSYPFNLYQLKFMEYRDIDFSKYDPHEMTVKTNLSINSKEAILLARNNYRFHSDSYENILTISFSLKDMDSVELYLKLSEEPFLLGMDSRLIIIKSDLKYYYTLHKRLSDIGKLECLDNIFQK